jgi:hypothetical protein
MSASRWARAVCVVVVLLAVACARNESAALLPDERYCDQVRRAQAAVDAHLAAFLELGADSGPEEGAELARLSSDVADAAAEAGELASPEGRSAWAAFERLYRRQARALARHERPFDAILDLEEGAVEWSAVHDSVADEIGSHVQQWCAFDPGLGG